MRHGLGYGAPHFGNLRLRPGCQVSAACGRERLHWVRPRAGAGGFSASRSRPIAERKGAMYVHPDRPSAVLPWRYPTGY